MYWYVLYTCIYVHVLEFLYIYIYIYIYSFMLYMLVCINNVEHVYRYVFRIRIQTLFMCRYDRQLCKFVSIHVLRLTPVCVFIYVYVYMYLCSLCVYL